MNMKHLSIISLLFVVSIMVAGCSPAEDISPSTRLVGHWEAPYEGEDLPREIYLGELSPDGKGKLYMTSDFVNFCERTYEILSDDEEIYTVRLFKEYTPNFADYSIEFRDDGFIMSYDDELIGEFMYVDTETEPDNFSPLAEKENEYQTTTSLTGHWGHIPEAGGYFDENFHVYFGRINDDGEGIYYESGEEYLDLKWTFKIVHEDGRDYDLQSKFECGGWDLSERWEVSEDGQNLKLFLGDEIFRFKYIDSNTEP